MTKVTVQGLYQELRESLLLEPLVELPERPVPVLAPDVHRPGMALMGFAENFLPSRIQVFGEAETAYLATLSAAEQRVAVERVLSLDPPVIIIAMDQSVPEGVLALARERDFPLLRTALPAVEFMTELSHHLERRFAPRTEVHGTLVDVYGVGLLFTGRSGIGKSECALDLIERGHRLVADDIVEIRRSTEDVLIGGHREVLRHHRDPGRANPAGGCTPVSRQEHHGDLGSDRPEFHAQDLRLRRGPGAQRADSGIHAFEHAAARLPRAGPRVTRAAGRATE